MDELKYNKASEDFAKVRFGDARLDKRLQKTVDRMSQESEGSILKCCGSTHDAKAFYALLSNDKFSLDKLQTAACKATVERIKASGINEVLIPQDTVDIGLNGHKKTEGLGYSSNHSLGILTHSALALKPDGTNLGLLTQQHHTRDEAKSPLSKAEKQKLPIEEKESFRWLETSRNALSVIPVEITPTIICDREGDFYELYCDMLSLEVNFIVRICQDRTTLDGEHWIQQIRRTQPCGQVEITIPRDTRNGRPARTAEMEVAYCNVSIRRPGHLPKSLPNNVSLTLVRITEITESDDGIEWFLATNRTVESAEDALKIVEYYTHRWKIERFHFILKSGCGAEKIQQRTYERMRAVLLIYSVIAAYILAITYFARNTPDAPCDSFLEDEEWKILYRLIHRKAKAPDRPYTIKTAVAYLGELGSYKHKPSDGEYGVKAVWSGLFKLFDAIDFNHRLMGQV